MKKLLKMLLLVIMAFSFSSLVFLEVYGASSGWVWVKDTVTGAYGEAVIGTGDALYIARNKSFYRYKPLDNSFVKLANPPTPDGSAFKTGTALAWDFGNYIYALFGAASSDSRKYFYRYSIPQNVWETLAETPYDQGEGDAITFVGEPYNCIYATIGGEQRPTYFMRYNPLTDSWDNVPADPPGGMGDGASMAWTGNNCIYILRGEYYEETPLCDFWRYNIADDAWAVMAEIPATPHSDGVGGVGDGGSLLYLGFWLPEQIDYIYALSGNQAYPEAIPDNRTYRYSISTNSWERLPDLPFSVGYYVGCRLGFADEHIYAWQGTPSTWIGGGDDLARYDFPQIIDLSIEAHIESPKIYYGQSTMMMVTVKNEGSINVENPLINIQLDSFSNVNFTLLGIIEPGKSRYQIFLIATIGPAGLLTPGNYTIRVEVYPLDGEVDVGDNVCILNLTVMPDDHEPLIDVPVQTPPQDNVQPFQEVKVSVNITDFESGVKNATLYYQVNEGEWMAKQMQRNITTGLYEATIDGYDAGTKIKYMLVAYDKAGNKVQQDNAGSYFIYTVISEFPSTTIMLLFIGLLSIIIVLLAKRRTNPKTANFSFCNLLMFLIS